MKEKKVTLSSLAVMIKQGFDHVDVRFERQDKKLEKIDKIDQSQEKLELRLTQMAPYFEVRELDRRVTRIEKKVGIK